MFGKLLLNNMQASATSTTPDIHTTRKENLLGLLHEFSQRALAVGKPAKGLEVQFAQLLNISPSTLSQLKKSRNISDKVATQIEYHTGKDPGWLDAPHSIDVVTDAESTFLDLAKKAWKGADAKEKRRLMQMARQAFS